MGPGWYAKLEGNRQVLDELVENFTEPRLRVTRESEPDGYFLGSTEFDVMADATEVRGLAAELLEIACGATEVERGHRPRPHVESVRRVSATGNDEQFVFAGAAWGLMPAEALLKLFPGEEAVAESAARIIAARSQRRAKVWAEVALADDDVRDVLAILGRNEVRWRDLYHVFEIVQSDVGGRMYEDGWATKAEVGRFTQTANSRGAIRREAIHGNKRVPPPPNPTSLDEARQLVVGIVRQWLEGKAAT